MSILNTTVLKLAEDSVNLGLCNSRDYFGFEGNIKFANERYYVSHGMVLQLPLSLRDE